ncbi:uncharacterized protein TM35_000231160 [Trypanosoma theileri]|uniref:EF-hand domain-containing protein n=1 Tax=Trypanosoma theileri TaxID=67003 RepID=A0A1X0NR07_9TRYP|nr:uncharacterized protein TM35_000231160 [Trypanosoma theileri]ORC87145.1 hypothetical protein TM35_000231160 [Trypanosoma theileri]
MGSEWSSLSTNHDTPPLNQKEAVLLANETHYRPEELKQLHSRFYRDIIALSSSLSDVSHQGIEFPIFCTCATFLGVKSPILQEMFFVTFDQNRDGIITFDEFAVVLSIMSRGTSREKIDLAFHMLYVVNNYPHPMPSNGSTLQRKGVSVVVEALKETFGSLTPSVDKQQEHMSMFGTLNIVEELFGSSLEVTRREFVAYVTRSPAVLKGLAIS